MRRGITVVLSTVGLITSGVYLSKKWNNQSINQRAICTSNTPSSLTNPPSYSTQTSTKDHCPPPSIKTKEWFTTQCNQIIQQAVIEYGLPGLSITVSVNGIPVYSKGTGLADIENNVPCTSDTVYRIASISKCITATALMQLVEEGKVNLDVPIQEYLPDYPNKSFQGEPVVMTTRQFLSHTSGTRHYHGYDTKGCDSEVESCEEYFIKDHYDSVSKGLKLFSNDPLLYKPGIQYYYTTFGYTVVSAIIEAVSGQTFLDYLKQNIFRPLGMNSTGPELYTPLIKHRARYYVRNADGIIENTSYVDNSYKWGGGGLVSSSKDLVKFGNALLVSYNQLSFMGEKRGEGKEKGTDCTADESREVTQQYILSPKVVQEMWKIEALFKQREEKWSGQIGYGLGWKIFDKPKKGVVSGRNTPMIVNHSGGAVGASSILTIIPVDQSPVTHVPPPSPMGVVVAILTNLQDVNNMSRLGQKIGLLAYGCFHDNKQQRR